MRRITAVTQAVELVLVHHRALQAALSESFRPTTPLRVFHHRQRLKLWQARLTDLLTLAGTGVAA